METIGQILKKSSAISMTESELQSKPKSEWEKHIEEREKEKKFWENNPTIPYENDEIDRLLAKIVPKRFTKANKNQIDTKIWSFAEDFFTGNGLYVWGPPGTGKTHLCSALVREYFTCNPKKREWYGIDHDYAKYKEPERPRMITIPDLLSGIKASFSRPEKNTAEYDGDIPVSLMTEDQIIKKYKTIEVLFLDDLGTEKTTDWSLQTIYLIIDYRYRENMQTVITSNLSLNELSDRTSDRITSRIAEMCKIIQLKGGDRRLK